MKPKYFDVHSHVSFSDYDKDRDEVLDRMKADGVASIIVGVDFKSSEGALKLAELHENLYASIGVHPADNRKETFDPKKYETLVNNPNVVAIGECGLDYFRIDENDVDEKNRQRNIFLTQIDFAAKNKKAMMLHCRPRRGTFDTYLETLETLEEKKKEYGDKLFGNVHFFVGNTAIARRFYDINFTTSFTGVITFAHNYDDTIRAAPINMLLAETDCPFATPVPFRGKRNEPIYVEKVVRRIAEIRGEDFETVRGALVENAYRVFSIDIN